MLSFHRYWGWQNVFDRMSRQCFLYYWWLAVYLNSELMPSVCSSSHLHRHTADVYWIYLPFYPSFGINSTQHWTWQWHLSFLSTVKKYHQSSANYTKNIFIFDFWWSRLHLQCLHKLTLSYFWCESHTHIISFIGVVQKYRCQGGIHWQWVRHRGTK